MACGALSKTKKTKKKSEEEAISQSHTRNTSPATYAVFSEHTHPLTKKENAKDGTNTLTSPTAHLSLPRLLNTREKSVKYGKKEKKKQLKKPGKCVRSRLYIARAVGPPPLVG